MYWNILFKWINGLTKNNWLWTPKTTFHNAFPCQHMAFICKSNHHILLQTPIKKITKVARPANSALSVALVTVDSSRWLDPQNPLTQTNRLLCTDFFPLNTRYIACFRLSVILNIPQIEIVIGDNNREYLIHQPWIHGTSLMWAPHVWCCVTDFSSLTALLE